MSAGVDLSVHSLYDQIWAYARFKEAPVKTSSTQHLESSAQPDSAA